MDLQSAVDEVEEVEGAGRDHVEPGLLLVRLLMGKLVGRSLRTPHQYASPTSYHVTAPPRTYPRRVDDDQGDAQDEEVVGVPEHLVAPAPHHGGERHGGEAQVSERAAAGDDAGREGGEAPGLVGGVVGVWMVDGWLGQWVDG